MFESKRSRGLALSAVSALAVSGLTVISSPASAAPNDAVVMLSQLGGKASVRRDGTDTNPVQHVDLVAERLDDSADITFEVNVNPAAGDATAGWMPIEGTPDLTGDFAELQWDAAAYVDKTVSLRAVATSGDRTSYSTVKGVTVTGEPGGAATPHSVSVDSQRTGYFVQPYAGSGHTATPLVLTGSSSATEGTVGLSWWRSSDGTFRGGTDAALSPTTGKTMTNGQPAFYPAGRFDTVLDITGYDADAGGDVIAVRGVRDSDDVAPIEVYRQTIRSAVAYVPQAANSRQVDVTVSAVDTEGQSVVGAEVRRLKDQKLIGYTDRHGQVVTKQAAGTTETYYVNATDADGFDADIDFTTGEVATPEFTPEVSHIVPVLADGDHFDQDEYADGDIAVQLVDQDGEPIKASGQQIGYALYAPHADGDDAPEQTVATPDAEGRLVIPADAVSTKGDYFLDYSLRESGDEGWGTDTVSLTSGDSTLTLTPDKTAGTAASGGQITYTGKLDLDGTPLAGRSIDLAYARGTEAAPGTAADAGIVVGNARVLTTTVTTDEEGEFTVTVADPAETGLPGETGGTLTATAAAAKEAASATTTFTAGPVTPAPPSATPPKAPAVVKLKLSGSSKGRAADKLTVSSARAAAGQRVRVYAKNGKGGWKVVKTVRLDRAGRITAKIKDRNGTKITSYRVRLDATASVASSTSNVKRLR